MPPFLAGSFAGNSRAVLQAHKILPLRQHKLRNVKKLQTIPSKKLSVLHKRVLNRSKALPRINCVAS
jgi:hypothetical protein